ncbi:hypothetical protein KGQ19_40670 [Catenulispora sp. NL8]|uniref:Biotin-protein ligase N-terminal domain-containing protein n=1 Tax=Catenulispora pinistramenti TaxID=2705254 RepID=A0ABS5L4D1_9ACTN|nr:BPL-N domain-containing protein [Catenulispora pinistramenti]MBS2553186.1 hypothetical protein [Catenulispora pinistramenti]
METTRTAGGGKRSGGRLTAVVTLVLFAVSAAFGLVGCGSRSAPTNSPPPHGTALVYRGRAACDGCAEAAAGLLTRNGFTTHYVGKGQEYAFSAATLSSAAVYVQPGGSDDMSVDQGWQIMQQDNPGVEKTIQNYVNGGGHFLGLCMGGYLAGTPGFGLLSPGDSEQYIATSGATVSTTDNTLIAVTWRDQQHQMYFQDGPAFVLDGQPAEVLARYSNGPIAAAVLPLGAGRVAVVGPHPEATSDWYADYGLADHSTEGAALGDDLLATLLK